MPSTCKEIKKHVSKMIETQNLKPGKRLGTMRNLSKDFHTSVMTVSTAMKELAREGKLIHIPNKGFFVPHISDTIKGTICAIIPSIDNSTFSDFFSGIEHAIQQRLYIASLITTNNSIDKCFEAAKRAVCIKAKGVIYAPGGGGENFHKNVEIIEYLRSHNINVALAGEWEPENLADLPSVSSDHYGAMSQLTYHLIKLGHRDIFVICPEPNSDQRKILDGYHDCMKKYTGNSDDNKIKILSNSGGVDGIISQILHQNKKPDAIIGIPDGKAVEALLALKKNGIKVPDDISVAGFGDSIICKNLEVPLTTVSIQHHEQGILLGGLLIDSIEKRISNIRHVSLPCKLIIRESCSTKSALL